MKKIAIIIAIVGVAGVLIGTLGSSDGKETPNYRLVTVGQGDIESLVSATGTLDAVTTVQVGTQVSGIVDEICVDYNDPVAEGQVIARIDTSLLANAVASSAAQLARAEAELRQTEREHLRITALFAEELVAESEANSALYSFESAQASVKSAEADLARARQNLEYATITSPIDGTVIARSVDVGQTVQASFSAPELFLIAGDLKSMQILVSVDESDIGLIAEGQEARFTVQAYPDDTFTGTVRQVRLQSATTENVVNYTAVVDVANPDGVLLPGMTATVDFLVETATDVTYVANASLRYKPDQETMVAALEKLRSRRESSGGARAGTPPSSLDGSSGAGAANRSMLWTLDENGGVSAIPVKTGISDGTQTVVMGRNLEAGLQVIAGVSSSAASSQSTSSPFQQQRNDDRGGPPPPPGGMSP